jgi:DNA-binding NtrC family response regulator
MAQVTATVLDSHQGQRDDIRNRLLRCGILPICFQDEWICLENIHYIRPDFALLHTDSYTRAFRFVNVAKAIRNDFPILVLSEKNDVEGFVQNNWLANLRFLRYPAEDEEIKGAIGFLEDGKQPQYPRALVAASTERKRLMQELPLLGLSREPILVQGARGVGKKCIARAIHGFSAKKDASLEFIDAGGVDGNWIRKTEKRFPNLHQGAPAGTSTVRVIENLENLPPSVQSQLLLLMENINSDGPACNKDRVSAPFISLAGGDLDARVQSGAFRKDLYHRLSVLKLSVPQLCGHDDDIRAMAEHFAARYGIRTNGGICRLPKTVMDSLAAYHWPGNIPELKQTVLKTIAADQQGKCFEPSLGPCAGGGKGRDKPEGCGWIDAGDIRKFIEENADFSLKKAKTRYAAQVEKKIMKAALAHTNGNCKKAAVLLNISYKSMLNKAKAYRLV